MNDIILLKVGEIILKGLNRRRFEQKLLGNIRWRLSRLGKYRVYILQSTIYVEGDEGADMDLAFEELQKVFGVVAISQSLPSNTCAATCCAQRASRWNRGARTSLSP